MKSNYPIKRLIDVASLVNRRVQPFNGELHYLATGDINYDSITSSTLVTYVNRPSRADLLLQDGDVAFARMKETVKVLQASNGDADRYIISTGFAVLSPNPKILNSGYLKRFCLTNYFQKAKDKLCSGATQKAINNNGIANLKIPIPYPDDPKKSLAEQQRIAGILDKADAIRKKRRQALTLADEFLKSTFLDMFGDPVANPKKWPVKNLENISSKILSGTTPKGGKKVYVKEGITFFRSQNVWRNKIVYDDVAFIDIETQKKMLKSSLKNKDILMTKTGRFNTENSSLGRAALFLGKDDSANLNGHVYLIRLNKGVIHEFVLFILTTDEYREYIRSICVGGIDKRQINKHHLEKFPIILPPKDQQEKFAEIAKKQRKLVAKLEQSKAEADNLFNSLVQRAFSGRL